MKFVRRLICAMLVSLWPLPVWRSSFSHVKNHREYVVGRRKNKTFDENRSFWYLLFLTIFDHFCQNFCKIKQHIKRKYYVSFMWINRKNSSHESLCFNETFYIPHYWYLFHLANIRFRMFLQQMVFLRYNGL